VSRGELVEIGGGFRVPEIMAESRCRLVEVGTTNRTRIGDYRAAFTDRVGAVLKVHPSNYRVVGFTASAATTELARLAQRHEVPFLFDVGSGLLRHGQGMPRDEPAVADALTDGADLVTFSGDKLLGGPQAGIIVGRATLVAKLRRHPIARAVRVDKMQVAALEQVLAMTVAGDLDHVPVVRMLQEPAETVHRRAQRLNETIGGDLEHAHVHRCESAVGGGSMPGSGLPSWGVRITVPEPSAFAARLRAGRPSVFGRVEKDHVLLDLRTVTDEQVPDLARATWYALEGDDLDDED
jgi:L-seryl-tRNA(Ser) seleniumtransferase